MVFTTSKACPIDGAYIWPILDLSKRYCRSGGSSFSRRKGALLWLLTVEGSTGDNAHATTVFGRNVYLAAPRSTEKATGALQPLPILSLLKTPVAPSGLPALLALALKVWTAVNRSRSS